MDLPVVDLAPYLQVAGGSAAPAEEDGLRALCATVSASLRDTGALLVKDPRCSAADNDRFLDVVERYFTRSDDAKRLQERPHLHYQVGVTPEGVEVPRSLVDKEMQDRIKSMPDEFQPATPKGPDPKWRYMWRVGPRPSNTRFKELNSEPVIPDGLPEWKETMDSWGSKMISAIEIVAEMAAIGFGLPKDAFTSLMKEGPHLLAPTGSDLLRHGSEGTVFAGFHYDLNFLTIHGRSRFPGLNIWLRNGKKMEVKVPLGCLLIQSGKQLEWLTGGECLAGMHEVVVTKRTLDAIALAKEQKRGLWRSRQHYSHTLLLMRRLSHWATSLKHPMLIVIHPCMLGIMLDRNSRRLISKKRMDSRHMQDADLSDDSYMVRTQNAIVQVQADTCIFVPGWSHTEVALVIPHATLLCPCKVLSPFQIT